MTHWIRPPAPPVVVARTPPLLVVTAQLDALRGYADAADARKAEADVSAAEDTVGVIGAIRSALPFPDWCGSGWDSIDDAFQEIRAGWAFPLLLILIGYDRLLERHQHLALEASLRLHELTDAFSQVEDQFMVAFEGRSWT